MYTFIDNNTMEQHDAFVKKHELCNLLQSAKWANVKDNWGHAYTAVKMNDEIVAVAMVLIKYLPMGFTMMYIPRGPIMDYLNKEIVSFYIDELKKWAKKKKCLFITMDPAYIIRQFDLKHKDTPYVEETNSIISLLEENGAVHKGFTKEIAETIQPRFHMGVFKSEDWEKKMPKSTMKSVRKAITKHVEIEEIDIDEFDEFARMMQLTEERKNVSLRNKQYFEKIKNIYGKDAHFFLAKVDPTVREKELLDKIEDTYESLDKPSLSEKSIMRLKTELGKLEEELESIQKVVKIYKEKAVIACGMMIEYGNYAEMLYAGMDDKYRAFRSQYYLYIKQFEIGFNNGCNFVTMGGVEGTLEDGLSIFKSNFNPTVVEYIGEFDIPVLTTLYKAAKFMQKVRTGK